MPKDPICGMAVLENSPFQAGREGKRYFFCSSGCQKKFTTSDANVPRRVLPKTIVSLLLFGALFFLSRSLPSLQHLHHGLVDYLKIIWWAVGLGLFLGGLIDYYVPKEHISYLLAGSSKRSILRATFLGFLASACSHGILALTVALFKKGASVASTISFLLASPWANLSVTFLLLGLFGMKGWLFMISAIGIAILTGLFFQTLSRRRWVEENPNTVEVSQGFSVWEDLKRRWKAKKETVPREQQIAGILQGIFALSDMVLPWVLLGVGLAGAVSAFFPKELLHRFFGPTPLGLLWTLAAATVIETCSEGSAPLAFELYRSTGAFGNVLVFLMAGVITDYTEISLIWANIGKRTAFWMVFLTVPQVLLLGLVFNLIF